MDDLGLPLLIAFMVVVGLIVSISRLPNAVKLLVYAALALRLVGTLGRHYMVVDMYGTGDSFMYFDFGVRYAEQFWRLDFSPLWDPDQWRGSQWWGTQFLRHVAGLVLALIGPSFLGGFLAFSLLAFVGLVGFGAAFARAYPDVPLAHYLRWAWLFPSLWFWPSAIGKEAILLLGLGLATWGFVGKRQRVNWLLLIAGLFLIFAVRVQVAAVFILAMVLAQWLSLEGRWTIARLTQGAVILAVGLGGIYLAMQNLGVESLDGVQTYLEDNTGRGASDHGSTVDSAPIGLSGIPVALINMLVRPFPWEARNPQMMISALEIGAFWCIVWYRRSNLLQALRSWRSDRLLRVAVPFILLYAVSVGMLMANMGIIARQRIFLFPFLFLLLEAVPRVATAPRRRSPAAAPSRTAVVPAGPL